MHVSSTYHSLAIQALVTIQMATNMGYSLLLLFYCVIIHNPQITYLQSSDTYSRMNNTVSSLFVFWFHINSEVETVLFQVLSSIFRVSYLIMTDNDSGVYISQVAPCDLELLTSFQVMLTMPIKKLQ